MTRDGNPATMSKGTWNGPFAEASEVGDDPVEPGCRIGHLNGQAVSHFPVPPGIHFTGERLPGRLHCRRLPRAGLILDAKAFYNVLPDFS